jgi:hypothetical protein
MRSLRRVLATTVVLGAITATTADGQTPSAGAAKSPLTLQATCSGLGDAATMRVQIANASDRPTAVVLGFTAPDGRTQVVNAIGVSVIRIATGATEEYVYVNPKFALAQGPPWVVSLRPGATHAVELPLRDFISTMSYANLDVSVAAGGRLFLDAQPAPKATTPVWTGRIDTAVGGCG